MTEQQHPTTPPSIPDEQVKKWREQYQASCLDLDYFEFVRLKAAQWGWQQRDATVPQELQEAADQELEACCAEMRSIPASARLRAARRPEPLSLKEQTLNDFDLLMSEFDSAGDYSNCAERIRRALQSLPG